MDDMEFYALAEKYQTVWDLCGTSEWIWQGCCFRLKGGKTIYEGVKPSRTQQSVLIYYLKPVGSRIKVISRYIHPDTRVELVRCK